VDITGWFCGECGYEFFVTLDEGREPRFCPQCGAKDPTMSDVDLMVLE
jgi:ribosomal protein S27AE